jgi:hypothetical protein
MSELLDQIGQQEEKRNEVDGQSNVAIPSTARYNMPEGDL